MKNFLSLVLLFYFLGFSSAVFAQSDKIDLKQINKNRLAFEKKSMYVLGGWSVANFTYNGAVLLGGVKNGEAKYFYQSNIYWNTINFALAGGGLLFGKRNTALNYSQTLKAYHSTQKVLLFNAGIDVGYIMTGLYLRERAKTRTDIKTTNQFLGYGKSLIVQGGFLLLFDASTYLLSKRQSDRLYDIPVSLALAPNHLQFTYRF